ncbi:hypothetical protein ACFE04_014127 [Oxalis oulophora]
MNTKTMRLPPRRMLTTHAPPGASSKDNTTTNTKRKERETDYHAPKSNKLSKPPSSSSISLPPPPPATPTATAKASRGSEPATSNKYLAGYLAYEFLTNGTLFGEPFDPARSLATPVSQAESRKQPKPMKASAQSSADKEGLKKRIVEVNDLLARGGAHLPGIVNPAQIARFLQM